MSSGDPYFGFQPPSGLQAPGGGMPGFPGMPGLPMPGGLGGMPALVGLPYGAPMIPTDPQLAGIPPELLASLPPGMPGMGMPGGMDPRMLAMMQAAGAEQPKDVYTTSMIPKASHFIIGGASGVGLGYLLSRFFDKERNNQRLVESAEKFDRLPVIRNISNWVDKTFVNRWQSGTSPWLRQMSNSMTTEEAKHYVFNQHIVEQTLGGKKGFPPELFATFKKSLNSVNKNGVQSFLDMEDAMRLTRREFADGMNEFNTLRNAHWRFKTRWEHVPEALRTRFDSVKSLEEARGILRYYQGQESIESFFKFGFLDKANLETHAKELLASNGAKNIQDARRLIQLEEAKHFISNAGNLEDAKKFVESGAATSVEDIKKFMEKRYRSITNLPKDVIPDDRQLKHMSDVITAAEKRADKVAMSAIRKKHGWFAAWRMKGATNRVKWLENSFFESMYRDQQVLSSNLRKKGVGWVGRTYASGVNYLRRMFGGDTFNSAMGGIGRKMMAGGGMGKYFFAGLSGVFTLGLALTEASKGDSFNEKVKLFFHNFLGMGLTGMVGFEVVQKLLNVSGFTRLFARAALLPFTPWLSLGGTVIFALTMMNPLNKVGEWVSHKIFGKPKLIEEQERIDKGLPPVNPGLQVNKGGINRPQVFEDTFSRQTIPPAGVPAATIPPSVPQAKMPDAETLQALQQAGIPPESALKPADATAPAGVSASAPGISGAPTPAEVELAMIAPQLAQTQRAVDYVFNNMQQSPAAEADARMMHEIEKLLGEHNQTEKLPI